LINQTKMHQDFNTVNIGHGKINKIVNSKMEHRIESRLGNTKSIKKDNINGLVSKSVLEATDAQRREYCNGKEILRIRTSLKKSQKEFAKMLNQKTQTLNQLEQGKLTATPQNKILCNKIKNLYKKHI